MTANWLCAVCGRVANESGEGRCRHCGFVPVPVIGATIEEAAAIHAVQARYHRRKRLEGVASFSIGYYCHVMQEDGTLMCRELAADVLRPGPGGYDNALHWCQERFLAGPGGATEMILLVEMPGQMPSRRLFMADIPPMAHDRILLGMQISEDSRLNVYTGPEEALKDLGRASLAASLLDWMCD